MKPFRRTQVITTMAACAISTAWGQQAGGTPQAAGAPQAAFAPQVAGGEQTQATPRLAPRAYVVDEQSLDQDMQCGFELVAIRFAQRGLPGAFDNLIQFFSFTSMRARCLRFFFMTGSATRESAGSVDNPAAL